MRKLPVEEVEALLSEIQKASGLDKRAFQRVRRVQERKISQGEARKKQAKGKARRERDSYYWDQEKTIEMHLHNLVFGPKDRNISVVDQAFREYSYRHGYWKTMDDMAIKKMIQTAANKTYKVIGKEKAKRYQGKPASVASALSYSTTELYEANKVERSHLRSFKNGTVNLKTGEITPHHPDDYLTSHIPYDYKPGSDCPKAMLDYVESSMGIDALDSVRAAISMILDPTAPDRFVHVCGPSGTGKGVFATLIRSMFGEDNVFIDNSFKKLAEADQRHQYLQGCSLWVVDDIVDYVGGEIASFYTLVERTPMAGRSLFSSKAYTTTFNTRFVVCSTGPIPIRSNASQGLTRRVFPLPTKALEINPDITLKARLQACVAEIISWALAMPKELRNDIILNPTKYNEAAERYMENSDLGSNSVRSFTDSCLEPIEPDGYSNKTADISEIYECYKVYCQAMGLKPMGKPLFVNQLSQAIPAHFVARHNATKGEVEFKEGKKVKVPSKWMFLQLLPGAFNIKKDHDYSGNGHIISIDFLPKEASEGNFDNFREWGKKYRILHPYRETVVRLGKETGPEGPERTYVSMAPNSLLESPDTNGFKNGPEGPEGPVTSESWEKNKNVSLESVSGDTESSQVEQIDAHTHENFSKTGFDPGPGGPPGPSPESTDAKGIEKNGHTPAPLRPSPAPPAPSESQGETTENENSEVTPVLIEWNGKLLEEF